MSENYDFVVTGGDSAWLVAVGYGAVWGAKVLLLEKRVLGAECTYTNCVLLKALIHLFAAV